jgi:hypothetical protein
MAVTVLLSLTMFLLLDTSPRLLRWLARVVTTLAAWLGAFFIVTTLLTLFRSHERLRHPLPR